MSFADTTWYCNAGNQSTTGYYAVPLRPQNAAVAAGQLVRQFTAPAAGNERCFVCIVAGTTANVTDATWVLTRGAKTTDGTATWMECTGQAALNGDLTNTATWAQVKAVTPAVLGQVIKRSNSASYQICTTAGAMSASEPAFSDTAGVTTTDTTAVWTSLGPVSNFTGGQAPHARLANACASTWFASGNVVYVGDNHAESQATTLTIGPQGNQTNIGKIICHNHSGPYPPASGNLMTGGSISTTAAVALNFTPGAAGGFYIYGLTFAVAVGQSSNTNLGLSVQGCVITFDACLFNIATTGGAAALNISSGVGPGAVTFNNATVKFASVSQQVVVSQGQLIWQNSGPVLAAGSSVPGNFINVTTTTFVSILFEAVDLSQLTGSLMTSAALGSTTIKDCKLNSAASFVTTAPGMTIQNVRSDSAATAYKSARYQYEGTETTETSITRVGGAADPTGQAQSRKIVTTANSQWLRPFKAEPYAIWNPTTGANVTVTVCGTINAGTLPNNDDIWLEVEYLGSATSPLGTILSTTKSNLLAANAAVASDSSTWNGGGSGAGWSPFKLVATLSAPQPGLAGYIYVRPRVASPAATVYFDPQPALS